MSDLVGSIEVMVAQLFDDIYPSEEVRVGCAVAAGAVVGLVSAMVGCEEQPPVPEEKPRGKKGAKSPPPPPTSPPPGPVEREITHVEEDPWCKQARLVQQQAGRDDKHIAEVQNLFAKRSQFLHNPPNHLQHLVSQFMASLGPFQRVEGRRPTLEAAVERLSPSTARQRCLATDAALYAVSKEGEAVVHGDKELEHDEGWQCYMRLPSLAGTWRERVGIPGVDVGLVELHQAGDRVWGEVAPSADGGQHEVVGAVTHEGRVDLRWGPRGGEMRFEGDFLPKLLRLRGNLTTRVGPRPSDLTVQPCEFVQEKYGATVSPVRVHQVGEIFQNDATTISVRFSSVQSEEGKPDCFVNDFRMFRLDSPAMEHIVAVGPWMSGKPFASEDVIDSSVREAAIDVTSIIQEYRSYLKGDLARGGQAVAAVRMDETQTPDVAADSTALSGSKRETHRPAPPRKAKGKVFTEADKAITRRMNAIGNHLLNPRALPPGAVQPPHAVKHAGDELRYSHTPVMSKAVVAPSDTLSCDSMDSIFAVDPAAVLFSRFTPGETISATLVVTNRDKVSRRVRVAPPTTHTDAFRLTLVSQLPAKGAIAPGMSMKYRVDFTPRKLMTYQDQLVITTEWSSFSVPLEAKRPPPILLPPATVLGVGACLVGRTASSTFTFTNSGGWGSFTVSPPGEGWVVAPETFSLAPHEKVKVRVSFTPKAPQSETTTLVITADDGTQTKVEAKGAGYYPDITLLDTDGTPLRDTAIVLGKATVSSVLPWKVTIHNRSPVPMPYKWVCESVDDEDVPLTALRAVPPQGIATPSGTTTCELHFAPTEPGQIRGRCVLLAPNIPEPTTSDHPLYGRGARSLPPFPPPCDVHDPAGFFAPTQAPGGNGEGEGDYVIGTVAIAAEGVPTDVVLDPPVLRGAVSCCPQVPNRRKVRVVNRGTAPLRFWFDPPDPSLPHDEMVAASKEAKAARATHVQQFNLHDVSRGVSVVFDPPEGVVPAGGDVTVSVVYSCLFVQETDLLIPCWIEYSPPIHLRLIASAKGPNLLVSPSRLSFESGGVLTTNMAANGTFAEQKVTLENLSSVPIAFHMVNPGDHLQMQRLMAHGGGDATFTPTFRFNPEYDLLHPNEKREATIIFTSPDEVCSVRDVIEVFAAPPIPWSAPLVESFTDTDLKLFRDSVLGSRLADLPPCLARLAEAIALLLGILPCEAEPLYRSLSSDVEDALEHIRSLDVSRRGLGLRLPANRAGEPPLKRGGGLMDSGLLVQLCGEDILPRLAAIQADPVMAPEVISSALPRSEARSVALRLASWVRIVTGFLTGFHATRSVLSVEAEVQEARACILPTKVQLRELHVRVPTSQTVTLRNISAIDMVYRWGKVDETSHTIVADPSEGLLPGGCEIAVEITVLVHSQRDSIDDVLPCFVCEAHVETAERKALGVNLLSSAIIGTKVSITDFPSLGEVPTTTDHADGRPMEDFCRHLLLSCLATALDDTVPEWVPEINFGTVPLFGSAHRAVAITNHGKAETSYSLSFTEYPAPPQRTKDEATRLISWGSPSTAPSKSPRTAPNATGAGPPTLTLSRDHEKLGYLGPGKLHTVAKLEKDKAKRAAVEVLSARRGCAFESSQHGGVVPGEEIMKLVLTAHANLPGRFTDAIDLSVDGLPRVRLPVVATSRGQPVSLLPMTAGLTLDPGNGRPAVLNFAPVPPQQTVKKVLHLQTECPVDLELTWKAFSTDNFVTVNLVDDGDGIGVVLKEADGAPDPSLPLQISPPKAVIQAFGTATFTVTYAPTSPGCSSVALRCSARTAVTPANRMWLQRQYQELQGGPPVKDTPTPTTSSPPIPPPPQPEYTWDDNYSTDSSDEEMRRNAEAPLLKQKDISRRHKERIEQMEAWIQQAFQRRWALEAEHALPVDLDVKASCHSYELVTDPKLIKFPDVRGAPGPFDRKADGMRRAVRVTNQKPFAIDFRMATSGPFAVTSYTVLDVAKPRLPQKGLNSSISLSSTDPATTLFRLNPGESLDAVVDLLWDEHRAGGTYRGLQGEVMGATKATSYKEKGHTATVDIARLTGSLDITFPNGTGQSVDILALVHFPAVACHPSSLTFGSRPEDRNPSWAKRLTLSSLTLARASFKIVHVPAARPVTIRTVATALEPPKLKQLQKVMTAQLDGVPNLDNSLPIDDPSVFRFEPAFGSLTGVALGVTLDLGGTKTASLKVSGDKTTALPTEAICLEHDKGGKGQIVKVFFTPHGSSTFESKFCVEVDGGRGCEFTLRGHSAQTEHTEVAEY